MAWIVWRTERTTGQRTAQVKWRSRGSGRLKSVALGPVSPAEAEEARVHAEAAWEGRQRAPKAISARMALGRFLSYLRFLRRSRRTVQHYRYHLAPLLAWLETKAAMERWTPRHLEAYLALHPEWSPRRVQMEIHAARRFIRWARKRARVPDFADDVRGPTVRTKETPHYTPAEVGQLLAAIEGERHELAVALACLAGLSLSDIRALTWEQVDLRAGMIVGRRQKTKVPFRAPILPALRAVLARCRPPRAKGLVCSLPTRDDSARNVAVRLCAAAGLPKGGWHRLRHSFGALLDASGASLAVIRTAMGHSPQSVVTLRYLHADDQRIVEAGEAAEGTLRAKRPAR